MIHGIHGIQLVHIQQKSLKNTIIQFFLFGTKSFKVF